MRINWSIRASLIALLAAAGAIGAQGPSSAGRGAIDALVTDTNLVVLSDASASILGSGVHVTTGSNGRFRILSLAAGQYILVIHRLGYVPSSTSLVVAENDTLRLSFALRPIVNALDTVVIAAARMTARMTEFEVRRKGGFGHFMTQGEMEERNSVYLSELLRSILSVRIEEKRGLQIAYNQRMMGQCPYQIFVDGLQMQPPVNLHDLPGTKELAGIEVYPGAATVPLQFKSKGLGLCGAILLWTRDGSN